MCSLPSSTDQRLEVLQTTFMGHTQPHSPTPYSIIEGCVTQKPTSILVAHSQTVAVELVLTNNKSSTQLSVRSAKRDSQRHHWLSKCHATSSTSSTLSAFGLGCLSRTPALSASKLSPSVKIVYPRLMMMRSSRGGTGWITAGLFSAWQPRFEKIEVVKSPHLTN